jgi:hypothetical protein
MPRKARHQLPSPFPYVLRLDDLHSVSARRQRATTTLTEGEAASVKNAFLFFFQSDFGLAIAIVAEVQGETAVLVMTVATETNEFKSDFVIGLLSLVP